jgi:hypothetical protein
MSDHSGSYMLGEILELMEEEQIFGWLGKEKTQTLIRKIIKIACGDHNCNSGEILENFTDRFDLCYCCLKDTNDLENGLCNVCRGDKGAMPTVGLRQR